MKRHHAPLRQASRPSKHSIRWRSCVERSFAYVCGSGGGCYKLVLISEHGSEHRRQLRLRAPRCLADNKYCLLSAVGMESSKIVLYPRHRPLHRLDTVSWTTGVELREHTAASIKPYPVNGRHTQRDSAMAC